MASKVMIGGLVAAAAALVLVVTNPSLADFSTRMDSQAGFIGRMTCKGVETGNYVVFSRYEYRCMTTSAKYVGVLGNYYELGKGDAVES
ncbi:MAG TPA: hypothetical protein VMU01_06880 [Rhizomicrobium sp.]|nr:hypothetical protein [Rhizomicrobium sp.]